MVHACPVQNSIGGNITADHVVWTALDIYENNQMLAGKVEKRQFVAVTSLNESIEIVPRVEIKTSVFTHLSVFSLLSVCLCFCLSRCESAVRMCMCVPDSVRGMVRRARMKSELLVTVWSFLLRSFWLLKLQPFDKPSLCMAKKFQLCILQMAASPCQFQLCLKQSPRKRIWCCGQALLKHVRSAFLTSKDRWFQKGHARSLLRMLQYSQRKKTASTWIASQRERKSTQILHFQFFFACWEALWKETIGIYKSHTLTVILNNESWATLSFFFSVRRWLCFLGSSLCQWKLLHSYDEWKRQEPLWNLDAEMAHRMSECPLGFSDINLLLTPLMPLDDFWRSITESFFLQFHLGIPVWCFQMKLLAEISR